MATTTKTATITIDDFYFSAGQAMISLFIGDEDVREEMIAEDKIVKWLKDNRPEYVYIFKYFDHGYGEVVVNEIDMLSDFLERKGLQLAFIKSYLGL